MKIKELQTLLAYLAAVYGDDTEVIIDGDGGENLPLHGGFWLTRSEPRKIVLQ